MDWNAAIEKNREALKRVLAMLVAMAGLGAAPTLPRHLYRAVLRLLRPAEAAARRLVIVAARGIVVALPPQYPRKPSSIILRRGAGTGIVMPSHLQRRSNPSRTAPRSLALPLFDPLPGWGGRHRPVARGLPRICVPGYSEPVRVPAPPSPDDQVDARRLLLRLQALGRALDDLPREAKRFARWRAHRALVKENRDAAGAQDRKIRSPFRRVWPLRPGRPPGWRRNPKHEVHEILNVAHGLATWALADTS